ncbi:MAG: hypothetical protein Fur0022_37690 [Anaerolineales bacterium]
MTQALFVTFLAITALTICQPVLAGQLQSFDLTEGTTMAVGNQGLYVAQTPTLPTAMPNSVLEIE